MGPAPHVSGGSASAWERAGAFAIAVEAATVLAGAGTMVVGWTGGGGSFSPGAAFVVAFACALAVGLVAVARALARGARWPFGAAVTWQLLQGAVALGSTGSRWWLAAVLLAPVPVALAGVVAGALRVRKDESLGRP